MQSRDMAPSADYGGATVKNLVSFGFALLGIPLEFLPRRTPRRR